MSFTDIAVISFPGSPRSLTRGPLAPASLTWATSTSLHLSSPRFAEVVAYVLLALVAEEGNDRFQLGVLLANPAGHYEVRAAARPDEHAVLPR